MVTKSGDVAILDVLDEIVIQYDDHGLVVWAAPSLSETLGVEAEQIIGTAFRIPLAIGEEFPPGTGSLDRRPVYATGANGRNVWLDAATKALPAGGFVVTARTLDDAGTADILQRLDSQNRTVWVTSSVERLTGWTVQECLGETRFEWIHPADTEEVAQAMIALRSGQRETVELKVRLVHRSGTYLWWSIHAHLHADTGEISLAYRNIDNEVLLRGEIDQQQALRGAVLSNLLDPFAILSPVWDQDGQLIDMLYVDANPAARHILGEQQSLLGSAVSEVLPAETAVELLELARESQRSGEAVTLFDHPLISSRTPGVTRRYDLRVWGIQDRFGVTWRDVTGRPTVADQAGLGADVVLRISDTGELEWVSASVHAVLGWEGSDLVGTPWLELIHPEDRGQLPGESGRVRVRMATKDADWRWTETTVRPVTAGQSGGHLAEVRDIDDEVRSQAATEAERGWLRSAFDAALDPFVLLTAVRDPDGAIVDFAYAEANDAACAYNGMTREVLLGSTLMTLLPVHAEIGLIDRYAHVVNSGEQMILEGFTFAISEDVAPRRLDLRAARIGDGLALTWRDVTESMVATEHLASSEARLSMMLETMAEGVMVHNLQGDVVEANRAARDILGLANGEITRERREASQHQLISADGTPLTSEQHPVARVMTTGAPVRSEVIGVRRPDSPVLWLMATCEPMVVDGQFVAVLSTFSDITETVTAERALRQSEQRYRMLAENASEVVVQTSSDRSIAWVSPSVQTVLGYSPEEFVGRRISDFLLPGEVERLQQEMAENIALQRPGGERRMRMRTADGSTRWMSVLGRAITDDSGAVVGGLDALRDIHDQVLAQTRLQQLLDSMAEGVVVLDAEGRITECNPAATTILGVRPSDLVGLVVADSPWPTIDHDGQPLPGTVHPAVVALRTGQRVHDQVIGYVRQDGATAWLLVSADPMTDPETGLRTRVVTTFIDITEMIEGQRRLQEAESRYRWLAENATDFVIYSDLEGRLRWVSPSIQRVLGWEPDELIGRPVRRFVHREDQSLITAVDADAESVTVRVLSAEGAWRWFMASSKPLEDEDGQVVGRVTGLQDVQSETEAREALRQAHERLELVLDASRLGLWDWNMRTGEVVFNEGWAQIVGYGLKDLEQSIQTWNRLVHPEDLARSQEAIAIHAAGTTPFYDVEVRMRHRDGHWVWVRARGRIVERDAAGQPVRMTGTHEDITAVRNASDALLASEERFRVAMASAPVGMAVLDLTRRIQQVNPALCALLGRSEDWLIGRSMADVNVAEDDLLDVSTRRRLMEGTESSITVDHRVQRGDHAHIWVQQSISLVRGAQGEVTGFVSQFTDITEARQARRRLRDLASRDPLTDLYNRRELTDRLHRLQETRDVEKLALLFIDLDGLKGINDSYGHLVGDEVIQQQAARVMSVVRSDDIVGRFGGDEFIVVAPGLSNPERAEDLARRIQQVTRQPIQVGDMLIDVTCSIGVSITDVAVDFDRLLARADSAVYQAKRAGRDRVVLFESGSGD